MEVSGNHFRGENCQTSTVSPSWRAQILLIFWPNVVLKAKQRPPWKPYKGDTKPFSGVSWAMLEQKLIKSRALREGLRFFAIYSSKMISRDLHGTLYINTHSISKRSTTAPKNILPPQPQKKSQDADAGIAFGRTMLSDGGDAAGIDFGRTMLGDAVTFRIRHQMRNQAKEQKIRVIIKH